jgi:hypothetical protein
MSDEARGANPYGELTAKAPGSGEIIQSSRAMQEVQAAIIMAKHDPRDPVLAADRALKECKRLTLAQTAIYTYPRGGTSVEGPSIRLAEAIARSWGNLQYGIIEVGREGDESSMLAYAWDLQSNNMARQEFKVRHVRDSREYGKKTLTDERDIYEITANAGARRLRACILKLIPGDVVDACVERCKLTIEQSMGRVEEAVPKMLDKFKEFNVTAAMIEKRLKKNLKSLTYQDLVNLGNVWTSIKDGMGSVEDYFEPEGTAPDKPAEGGRAEAARAAAARAASPPKPRGRPRTQPESPETSEPPPSGELDMGQAPAGSTQALRGELYKYISTRVPAADRPFLVKSVDLLQSAEEIKKFQDELKEKYEIQTY